MPSAVPSASLAQLGRRRPVVFRPAANHDGDLPAGVGSGDDALSPGVPDRDVLR
jgi:hypothetical protein